MIDKISSQYIRECGDYAVSESAIPERDVVDFARAIEKFILSKI